MNLGGLRNTDILRSRIEQIHEPFATFHKDPKNPLWKAHCYRFDLAAILNRSAILMGQKQSIYLKDFFMETIGPLLSQAWKVLKEWSLLLDPSLLIHESQSSIPKPEPGLIEEFGSKDLFQLNEYFYYLQQFLTQKGMFYMALGSSEEAEAYLLKAIKLDQKYMLSDNLSIMRQRLKTILALVSFYNWKGEYQTSRELAMSSLELFQICLSYHYNLDSLQHNDILKLEKARRCMQKIFGLLFLLLQNIIHSCLRLNEFAMATDAFNFSLELANMMFDDKHEVVRMLEDNKDFFDKIIASKVSDGRERERLIFFELNKFKIYKSYPSAVMEYLDEVNKKNQEKHRLELMVTKLLLYKETVGATNLPKRKPEESSHSRFMSSISHSKRPASMSVSTAAMTGQKQEKSMVEPSSRTFLEPSVMKSFSAFSDHDKNMTHILSNLVEEHYKHSMYAKPKEFASLHHQEVKSERKIGEDLEQATDTHNDQHKLGSQNITKLGASAKHRQSNSDYLTFVEGLKKDRANFIRMLSTDEYRAKLISSDYWRPECNREDMVREKTQNLSYKFGSSFKIVDGTMDSNEFGTFKSAKKKPLNRGIRTHQQSSLDWFGVAPREVNQVIRETAERKALMITNDEPTVESPSPAVATDRAREPNDRSNPFKALHKRSNSARATGILLNKKSSAIEALHYMSENSKKRQFSRSQSADYLVKDPLAVGKDSIDGYFKSAVYLKMDLPQMDLNLQNKKGNYINRIINDDFDKKELNFCKRMISVRGGHYLVSVDPMTDTDLAGINLVAEASRKMKIISTEARNREEEEAQQKIIKEIAFRKGKQLEKPKKKWSEIITSYRKVFKIDNTLQMKKKIEKDPNVKETYDKRKDALERKANSRGAKQLHELSNQLQMETMEHLEKTNEKLTKAEFTLHRENSPLKSSPHSISHSIFSPQAQCRLADSTRALPKQKQLAIHTSKKKGKFDDLAMGMVTQKKVKKELEAIQKQMTLYNVEEVAELDSPQKS